MILIFLGSLEAILSSICIVSAYFMFMYRFLSIQRADIFLGHNKAEVTFLGCLKISWTDPPYVYVLSATPGGHSQESQRRELRV